MLNTNLPNIEPREKELLLERRHSICLEISKKRRQSVATSIFLPKDCLKAISKPNGNHTTSRNKKFLSSIINKKRIFGLILAKKKLKRLAVLNKKKVFPKIQSIVSPLKHPESYPILRQSISTERIRCVVESLRDKKVQDNCTTSHSPTITENLRSTTTNTSEKCAANLKTEPAAQEVLAIEEKTIQNTEKEQISLPSLIRNHSPFIRINNSPKDDKKWDITRIPTNSENEASALYNKLLNTDKLYSSVNRVDNFLIMVDSTGSNLEIKYDGQSIPSSIESASLPNYSESDLYDSRHCSHFEKIKDEYGNSEYIKPNDCTATITSKKFSLRPADGPPLNTLTNNFDANCEQPAITTDNVLKSNLKQSIQDIIDLSIKGTRGHTVNLLTKESYAIPSNKPNTAHSTNTCPLFPHQTRSFRYRNRICSKTFPSANCPCCCYNYEDAIPPNIGAQGQIQFPTINPQPLQLHHHFIQATQYFETPSLSPREHQYMPMTSHMNSPMYDFNQNHQNKSIPETNQYAPANLITNAMHRLHQLPNQVSHIHNDPPHRQPIDFHNSSIQHPLRQVPENQQTHFQLHRQTPHSLGQYHHGQHNQMNYTNPHHQTRDYHSIDLPIQFYNNIHQNLFPHPNHFSSTAPALPSSNNGPQIFGAWRMQNSPMQIYPPHGLTRSIQTATPDLNMPVESLMSINFPFPSSNWANTFNDCSVSPSKTPAHLYSNHQRFNYDSDRANASNGLTTTRMISGHWPATYLNTQATPALSSHYM